ncbi:hypothetical protein A6A03_03570 [Chloroflexus islandicus]|uniref:WD40 repeat domain-containing protein n=2 Tax=Chloroflexus islandicus TaxID=1707952 RepID=A0A178M516_9CHLR|nr:hypothetical protein A6A03_03570 [Chloroflexus islandicus]
MRRLLLLVGGAITALVGLCGLALVMMMFWFGREEQPAYVWQVVTRSAAFLPDGRLAIANDKQTVIVSFPGYQTLRELPAGGYVASRPDGSVLAVAMRGAVKLFDPNSGALIGQLDCWPPGEHIYEMHLSFSPDGRILAVAESHHSRGPEVQFWDVSSQSQIGTIRFDDPAISVIQALAFSPTGHLVVSTHREGVWLVEVAQQAVIRNIQSWPSSYIAVSPDGSRLSLSEFALVRTFDTRTWQVVHEQRFAQARPMADTWMSRLFSMPVAISPDGNWLATPNREAPNDTFSLFESGPPRQTIALRRLADGRRVRVLSGSPRRLNQLLFSPDSRWLVDVGLSEIRVWRVEE